MIMAGFFTSLQAGQAARPQGGVGMFTALLPFLLVFVIFYLLIVMPQRKKQKKHMTMVEQLKPGDRLITSGGIYGTVMGVQPDRIELKVAANVKIDITKSAVAVILGQGQGQTTGEAR
jgi:preprotein translocase subunit YajC